MKVIHFITSIDKAGGGTTTYIQLLSQGLKNAVDLIVVSGISPHPIEFSSIYTLLFNLSLSHWFTLKKKINNLLVQEKPDIVHINGIWQPQCWLFQREAQRQGIKVILSPHGMLEPWIMARNPWKKKIALWLYQHKAIKTVDYLHATADSEKENIQKLGYTQPITVIANGIRLDEAELKNNWTPRRELLFLSRVHPKKGIEHLIEAVAQLKDEFRNGEILIAGEGEEKYIASLQQKINQYGIGNIIHFTGGVYDNSKWKLMREADIFVLPTYSENFGIVVAEALACGTPVITTRGTPWQELETEECGWWIKTGTEALVNALKEYISLDANQLEQMGRRGADLVKLKYSSEKMANDMLKLYQKVISL